MFPCCSSGTVDRDGWSMRCARAKQWQGLAALRGGLDRTESCHSLASRHLHRSRPCYPATQPPPPAPPGKPSGRDAPPPQESSIQEIACTETWGRTAKGMV